MLINHATSGVCFRTFFDPQRTRHFGLSLKTHTRRVELKLKWEDVKTCLILSAIKNQEEKNIWEETQKV